ncbi:hypothetical protein ACTPOE_05570 [Castellaniella sp. WN]
MKKTSLAIAVAAFMFSAGPAWAQSGNGSPATVESKSSAPEVADFDKRMETIQDNMRKMEGQMKELQMAKDADARERLLQAHWDVMRDTMRLMHDPQGPGPLGCCAFGRQGGRHSPMQPGQREGWREMGRYYSGMTDAQVKEHQYMMEQYMGMQQSLMQQMMWHQMMQRQSAQPPANR